MAFAVHEIEKKYIRAPERPAMVLLCLDYDAAASDDRCWVGGIVGIHLVIVDDGIVVVLIPYLHAELV
jgi:hypothetical protein